MQTEDGDLEDLEGNGSKQQNFQKNTEAEGRLLREQYLRGFSFRVFLKTKSLEELEDLRSLLFQAMDILDQVIREKEMVRG